jgi:uncharacterized membrane protein
MLKRKISLALLVIYAVLTIYTTVLALLGIRSSPIFTPIVSLLAFSFALVHSSIRLGQRRAVLLLALTFGVSLLFESVGVATGLVYGKYHYTDLLGPKFLGLVPYLIPVAWFMMTYPSYVMITRLAPTRWGVWGWRLAVAAGGAVVMTAWDLAMDPLMTAGSHWIWDQPGAYFGIPLQNYWGWWLTIFVTFLLFLILGRITPAQDKLDAGNFDRWAIVSYSIVGLSTVIIDLRIDLGGPGLVGLFAMLPWVLVSSFKIPE